MGEAKFLTAIVRNTVVGLIWSSDAHVYVNAELLT